MNEKMRVRLLSFDIERIDAGEGACSLYCGDLVHLMVAIVMNEKMRVRWNALNRGEFIHHTVAMIVNHLMRLKGMGGLYRLLS